MDDPQRLLDGTGPALERTLLQELRSYHGPKNMRAHTLAALGVTGTTSLAAGSALAWWSGKTWGAKMLLTVSAASVLVGLPAGYFILKQNATPLVPPVSPTIATMPPVQPLPAPEPPVAPPVLATPASPTPQPVARVSRRGVTTSTNLHAELEALDTVRATLARGDFFGSLSLLDTYFQNFHHGRLQLEAEVLRIDALARCGQAEAARSYAKEFLRRNPKSVHTARLQSIVGP
jgi:hypothetical protein